MLYFNFIKDILSKFKRNNPKNSKLYNYAKTELEYVLDTVKLSDDISDFITQKEINDSLLKCVESFCTFDHIGFSESYSIMMLIRLLNYMPLLPLTGSNREWQEVATSFTKDRNIIKKKYQNKRYFKLFKEVIIDKDTGEVIKEIYNDADYPDREIKFPYYPSKKEVI